VFFDKTILKITENVRKKCSKLSGGKYRPQLRKYDEAISICQIMVIGDGQKMPCIIHDNFDLLKNGLLSKKYELQTRL
jgi:hypothetical protein